MHNEVKEQILKLMKRFGPLWSAQLNKNKNLKSLKNYILENSKDFPDIPFKTKVYFAISGTHELAKCQVCGKILKNRECDAINGFGEIVCCSSKCCSKHPKIIEKIKKTCLEKYGTEKASQSEKSREKMRKTLSKRTEEEQKTINQKRKETCLEKYGVDSISKNAEIKQKMLDNWKNKTKEELEDIRNRTKATCLEKYGVEHPAQLESCKEKIRETWNNKSEEELDKLNKQRKETMLEKYGNPVFTRTEEYKQKVKETCLKRYGTTHYTKNEEFKEKTKRLLLEKFGKESFSQIPEIREKIDKTFIEKYGGKSPMCSYEIRKKARKKYLYDNVYFDSEPEVALYIWLKDNNIEFEYHPKLIFEYEDEDGEKRKYFPDFLIENKVVEVKANYWWKCASEKKKECISSNADRILFKKDYGKYIKYVKEKFGDSFLNSLKQYKP